MKTFPPEFLEMRIAPASFFLDAAGVLSTPGGVLPDYVDGSADKAASGADAAFHFRKGDVLRVLGGGPSGLLLGVEQGMAEAFFSFAAGGGLEMTGLAVSDGFKGMAHLEGSVATLLDAAGRFTPTQWQHASIAKLTLGTDAGGDLFAGGDIGNVRVILGKSDSGKAVSFDEIAAGSAVADHFVSLDGGGTVLDPSWTDPAEGTDGGRIKNLRLPHGATLIETGRGFSSETGRGGDGGDIVGIKIGEQRGDLSIQTGDGAEGAKGGGRGGDVRGITVGRSGDDIAISTGDGGGGLEDSGSRGGAGGDVADLSVFGGSSSQVLQNLGISTGVGGDGSYKEETLLNEKIRRTSGKGGEGGDISKLRLVVAGDFGGIQMMAGAGGVGFFKAHGGAGGNVSGFKLMGRVGFDQSTPDVNRVFAMAGAGGSVEAGATDDALAKGGGGRGGAISGMGSDAKVVVDVVDLRSGAGGVGWSGGDGGGVRSISLSRVEAFSIVTGKGGDSNGTKSGGDGGRIFSVFARDAGGVDFKTGDGGEGGGLGAFGGEGGDMINLGIRQLLAGAAGTAPAFIFASGDGGKAGETASLKARARAGGGGDLKDIILGIKLGGASIVLSGGDGGAAGDSDGRDGGGAALAAIHVTAPGASIIATGGDAGSAGAIAVRGGGIGVSTFEGVNASVRLFGGKNSDGSVAVLGPGVLVNGVAFP